MKLGILDQIKHLNLSGFDEFYRVLLLHSCHLPKIRIEPTIKILQATKEGLSISYEILSDSGQSEQLSRIENFEDLNEAASAWIDRYRPIEGENPSRPYIAALLMAEVLNAVVSFADESHHVNPDDVYRHGLAAGTLIMALKYEISGLSEALECLEIVREHTEKNRKRAQDSAEQSAQVRKQSAETWKSVAMEAARRLEPRSRRQSREQFVGAICREVSLTVGTRSILNWLKNEAEEPNGPLKKRDRNGIIGKI